MPSFDPDPFFAHKVLDVLKVRIDQYATEHGLSTSQVAAKFDLVPDGRGHILSSEIYVTNP